MDNRTYIVAMGDVDGSYVCKNFDKKAPKETVKDIHFIMPLNVVEFEGRPDLYTAKDLAKARGEGQAEAWELARKIVGFEYRGGYSSEELHSIFGNYTAAVVLSENTSFAEAQAKVIAYEEAFHVGDVVVNKFGSKAVITCVPGDGSFYIMYKDGSGSMQNKKTWWGDPSPVDLGWKKTGKRIDVSGITDELKE